MGVPGRGREGGGGNDATLAALFDLAACRAPVHHSCDTLDFRPLPPPNPLGGTQRLAATAGQVPERISTLVAASPSSCCTVTRLS